MSYAVKTEHKRLIAREASRRWKLNHPEYKIAAAARMRAFRAAHPEYYQTPERRAAAAMNARRGKLRRAYGMSLEEFNAMLLAQNNQCAICKTKPATHVDHNHKTGKVREVLCQKCNTAIGLFEDNSEICFAASSYLQSHESN